MASFLDAYVAPKKDIPRRAYLTVSTLVAASILALWCALSYGGVVRSDFQDKGRLVLLLFVRKVQQCRRWVVSARFRS